MDCRKVSVTALWAGLPGDCVESGVLRIVLRIGVENELQLIPAVLPKSNNPPGVPGANPAHAHRAIQRPALSWSNPHGAQHRARSCRARG